MSSTGRKVGEVGKVQMGQAPATGRDAAADDCSSGSGGCTEMDSRKLPGMHANWRAGRE